MTTTPAFEFRQSGDIETVRTGLEECLKANSQFEGLILRGLDLIRSCEASGVTHTEIVITSQDAKHYNVQVRNMRRPSEEPTNV